MAVDCYMTSIAIFFFYLYIRLFFRRLLEPVDMAKSTEHCGKVICTLSRYFTQ